MGGHHKAKNWGCPDTVDTNGSSPMHSPLTLVHTAVLYLQFYYISVAVRRYRVRGTWSTQFLRYSCSLAIPCQIWY